MSRATFASILLLLAFSIVEAQTNIVFVSSQVAATIVLDDFQISDTPISQGQTVSFSVTFENTGNAETTATARVYIFNAQDVLIDTVNYSSTSVAPNQQKVQIKSWNSNGYPLGAYTARANVTFIPYNYSTNVSNGLTVNFQIAGGGVAGGGPPLPEPEPYAPELPTGPVVLPPEIAPRMGGPVDFVAFPVLKEIITGQTSIQDIKMVNRRSEEQDVRLIVNGIAEEWVAVSSEETKVLPGETRNVDLAVSVPANAPVGDYMVRVDAVNGAGITSDFMILRVKSAGAKEDMPISLRTVEVDRVNEMTTVSVVLRNPSKKTIERIVFEDALPERLESKEVRFLDKPGEIRQVDGRRMLQWEVAELIPNEEFRLSYTINGVLNEYSSYVNWYAAGIEISKRIDLSDLVKIIDLSATAMLPGKDGQVVATVLYVGEDQLEATMTLDAPTGFTVNPSYLTVVLQPRTTFTARFDVGVPEDAQESQLARFVLFTDDGQVSARIPLVVTRPFEPPPSAAAISIKPMDIALGGLLIVVLGFTYMLYKRRREGGGARFDQERLEYARNLRKLMKTD